MNLVEKFQNLVRKPLAEKRHMKKTLVGEKVFIPLYSKEEIKADPSRKKATAVLSLIGKDAPTMIICPGGAYAFVSYINEGTDFAKRFNEAGYNVMIVNYRVQENARFPKPMEDLAKAMKFVRDNAEKYHFSKDKVFICGSSAGGHLCAYYGARYSDFACIAPGVNLRPSGVVLCYPVISMSDETHEYSRENLLSKNYSESEALDKSVELIADETYPPTFIWHCMDDTCVNVSNTLRLDKRLTEVGVKHQCNIYETGEHGCGLALNKEPKGWFDEMLKFIGSVE